MAEEAASRAARRARLGVAGLFFANGALFAGAVPRYPEVKGGLDLSNAAFGAAVAAYGLGALVLGLLAGALVARFGSARVAPVTTVVLAVSVVLIAAAGSWGALVVVLALAGAADSTADLAVNAHGLRVERLRGRPVLNSLHAVWSIGAVAGGAVGAAAAGAGVPLGWHLGAAAVVMAALAVGCSRLLLPGGDRAERDGAAPAALGDEPARSPGARGPRVVGALLVLGVVAAMAQTVEEAGATWGAVYLREELGAPAAVAGLAFIVLQATQTVGRLVGDRAVARFGDRAVARAGASLAGTAMAVALALPAVGTTVAAFGAVGLGIGTLIPASLRTADAVPGLPPGTGLVVVGTVLRLVLLANPVVVGLVADAASVRAGLVVIPAAAALVLLLSASLPPRPRPTS
ncbi:MAG: hypothetical protein AVDCRST_MAG35-249 [uncultured Quadrisphaera sp.]|uniref:Major facilitator superfamily (MFS) profile domain-containing protein n=1 Tax=uncultured Quadrisphaera sp. TaxID=904978 RepID=A0A6J4NH44_9ACTN|nr:MAG: hypothetical protein AVDCRST_MAG35-249 [uncultured Quadrisphaera sp.]